MKITHSMVVVFIGSFLIHFFVIPFIMVSNRDHITNHLGKIYLSVIYSIFLVILEVMMHDYQYNVVSSKMYATFGVVLAFVIYLYRTQTAIKDKQYVEGMLEHHSQSILTSEEILKKTNDYHITKLAKNIIQGQKDQIRIMQELLQK